MSGMSEFWHSWFIYMAFWNAIFYVSIGLYLSVRLPCGAFTNLRPTEESKTIKDKKITFVPRGFVFNNKKIMYTVPAFNKNLSVKTNAGLSFTLLEQRRLAGSAFCSSWFENSGSHLSSGVWCFFLYETS
jgi:hypothetical protein